MEIFKLNKLNRFDILILLNLALVGLIVWLTMTESSLVSNVFYTTFFVVVLSIYVCPYKCNPQLTRLSRQMEIIAFLFVILTSILGQGSFSFDYFINYFAFVFFLEYVRLMSAYRPTVTAGLLILTIGVVIASLFVYGFYVRHISATDVGGYFTMNFSNANLLAMFLYQALLYCFVGVFVYNKLWMKALCALIGVATFNLMMFSDSRNCIVAFALVVALSAFEIVRKKTEIEAWILKAIAAFPILFVWIYMTFVSYLHLQDDTILSHDGKNIDSRVGIWNHVLGQLGDLHLVFGNYPVLQGNAHNSHLSVWGAYGLVVLIMFIVFLYKVMRLNAINLSSNKQIICMVGFAGIIFMGMAEGAIVCGSLGLYIPACTYLALANVDWKEM